MHAYTLTAPPSVRNNEVILHLDGSAYSLGHWSKPIALRWASALSCLAGVGERLTVQPYKIQPDRVRSVFSQSGVALYVPTGMRAFMTRAETCDVRNPLGADSKADVQTTTGLDGQTQHVRLTDAAKTQPPAGDVGAALRFINAARAARYEKALDPRAAEWTDDDVLAEARRLGWSE